MEIKVFKFGGASVNSAEGVRNVAAIVEGFPRCNIVMVVSAMGKTTNALEGLLKNFIARNKAETDAAFEHIKEFHFDVLRNLFPVKSHPSYKELEKDFGELKAYLQKNSRRTKLQAGYNFEYDQVVSFGERFATRIVDHWLDSCGMKSKLFDARTMIISDSSYRDAKIDWSPTSVKIRSSMSKYFAGKDKGRKIAVVQGFIGSDPSGNTTTLGREGSDYTAAIIAHSMKTREVTIWKDVPGVMNADPKWYARARKIDLLSYREAIELAYFGASVIHPKTIKPLENANITLQVKSFIHPELPGTAVKRIRTWKVPFPIYIRKQNQVLISLSPRDFSFIIEENLSGIFRILAKHQIKANVMQNSAISFTFCVDDDPSLESLCLPALQKDYLVRFNKNLELFTIRHYNPQAIKKTVKGRKILLEQKTRNTVHLVLK